MPTDWWDDKWNGSFFFNLGLPQNNTLLDNTVWPKPFRKHLATSGKDAKLFTWTRVAEWNFGFRNDDLKLLYKVTGLTRNNSNIKLRLAYAYTEDLVHSSLGFTPALTSDPTIPYVNPFYNLAAQLQGENQSCIWVARLVENGVPVMYIKVSIGASARFNTRIETWFGSGNLWDGTPTDTELQNNIGAIGSNGRAIVFTVQSDY